MDWTGESKAAPVSSAGLLPTFMPRAAPTGILDTLWMDVVSWPIAEWNVALGSLLKTRPHENASELLAMD